MKTLELNQMENISGEGCGSAIAFGLLGGVILGLATASAPVISGWTAASVMNIATGVAIACKDI